MVSCGFYKDCFYLNFKIFLFDVGSYVCKVGNGVNDFEGNVEKVVLIDLIVKSKINF